MNALLPIAAELTGSADRTMGRVTRYLSVQGYQRFWIEEAAVKRLWRDSVAQVDASDSVSHDFSSAMRVFAGKLGESAPFDALVVASLVYRKATLARGVVKWDGVTRGLPKLEADEARVPDSYQGTISAVSLHVMVFDASGELVFENYGGLDLAHAFSVKPGAEGELNARLRETFLDRQRLLNEGVELAFEPYLPRSPSSDW
jgi:hypothetical protein